MIRYLIVAATLALSLVAPAHAQSNALKIVAVVNDEVISALDIVNRMRLTMVSSGLPDTAEIRKRLEPQVLRGLIDERLQAQEAARQNVTVSDEDIEGAIGRIEQANRMRKGQLGELLTRANVPRKALEQQLRAGIAWQKLIQRRLRAEVTVNEEEVKEVLDRIKAKQGSPEFLLSEIFLPIDNPDQEDEVRQTAMNLIQQMQRGTSFPAIAQQFSQAASAANGGDIGWVQEGQLDEELEAAVKQLRPGEVTPPTRTPGGFYVYGLRGKRTIAGASPEEAVLTITQLILPARNANEARSSLQLASTVREAVGSCEELTKAAKEARVPPPPEPQRLRLGDVNPQIREKIRNLKAGEASEPIRAGNAVVLLMACTREEAPSGLPSTEDIQEGLLRQRLDLLARRYLRDLRRQAYVDIRA
ncbi:MAG: peptidylprolyl isomerase [Alphaproteobacteria bacterium]|nr:peptidylprolyl isomerase [Alphaproteobacteria bacterium]